MSESQEITETAEDEVLEAPYDEGDAAQDDE